MGTPKVKDRLAEMGRTPRTSTAVLDPGIAELAERLHEAELHLIIESTASRILGLALARGAEEQDAAAD